MVKVNFDAFDNKSFINYLNFLINRVFKILPISENEPSTLKDYLESLLIELMGNQSIIENLKHDANFLSLMGTLKYLIDNKCSHKTIKREVFKCISLIEKIKGGDGL